MKKKYILIIVLVGVILAADLVVKHFCVNWHEITVIKNVLSFNYDQNTGMAFGLFGENATILGILSLVIVTVFLLIDTKFKINHTLYNIALSFIIGGALGNAFDRLVLGYVRDFIRPDFVNFATFNIADTFLTIGAILLCVYIIFFSHKKHSKTDKN